MSITIARDLLAGDLPGEGTVVAHVSTDHGHFSVTGELYPSRRSYEAGNDSAVIAAGQITDELSRAFPELAPVMAVHLADVETGEPMHGPANGWYRLSGADMAHEIDGIERIPARRNYYTAPAHRAEYDHLSPDFAAFFLDMAARSLNVDVADLPNVQDPELFAEWVDDFARPHWAQMAAEAREVIAGLVSDPPIVPEEGEAEYEITGDAGLKARAVECGEGYRDRVGSFYRYRVTVSANRKRYVTECGGSVADFNAGRQDARGAVFNALRELREALDYETGEEWAGDMGMLDGSYAEMRDTVKALDRVIAGAKRLRAAIEANAELIGN